MGLDYSFQVYAHQRAARRLLTGVAALCDDARETTVVLPDETSMALPGAHRTVRVGPGYGSFALSPRFGTEGLLVAYTYLLVSDGSDLLPGHWIFDFTPATSAQSRLFLSSPSIREAFAELALSVAAPLCLLDVEDSHSIVVTAGDRRFSTRVPGPGVLWDKRAPADQVYRELLTGGEPEWILGPDHPDYPGFVAALARNSGVTGAVV
jgi:hypothetical protein